MVLAVGSMLAGGVLGTASLLLATTTALAQPGASFTEAAPEYGAPQPAPNAPPRTAYRRQLIVADSLAVATVGAGVAAGVWIYDPEDFHLPVMVAAFGFTSYVLTAPIIHFAHGNVRAGLLGLGARILIPSITASMLTVGLGIEDRDDGFGAAMGTGFAIGGVAAIALDWFVLTPSGARSTGKTAAPLVTPTISASAEHVFLGVGGAL